MKDDTKTYKSNGIKQFWVFVYIYLLMIVLWVLAKISLYEFIFYLIIPSTIFGVIFIISTLWIRNYDIYLFEIGLGIENKWRLIGQKKWKYKYNEIHNIHISVPYVPQSSANFIMKIDNRKFGILIKDKLMFDLVKQLMEKEINISFDSRATSLFEKQGIKIKLKKNNETSTPNN